jgi:hypothetical protein
LAELLDLDNLYKHLEEKAIDYKCRDIANLFQKIRDKMHVEKKADLEAIAQWEINIFNFSFAGNGISPLWTKPDSNGKLMSYPTYDDFVPESYDYIIKRLDSTNNPMLKARYAHVLWCSPKKHGKYAQLAIDGYLELIKLYEQKDKENPQKHFGFDVLSAVENALLLSRNINDTTKIDLAKLEVKRLIFNFNPESTCLFRVRADLLGVMINKKTIFSKDDFNGINDLCFNFSKTLGDSHQAITILQLGEKVEQKAGTTKYNWNDLIGESYEKMMNANLPGNKHVAIEFCRNALEYYKLSKNQEKIEKLETIYTELKGILEFPKIEVEIDLKEYIADCEKRVKELIKFTPEQIIGFIMTDKSLLPEFKSVKELEQNILKQFPMQAIFPITLTDEQGHTAQCFATKEEIEFYRTLQQYRMILENYCMPMLNMVFIEGLKENKINFQAFMEFFQKYSWFGKTIPRKMLNKEVPHNWLSLIAPSLFEYFSQMDYWMASGKYPNLVLCIDSLVLKIEGLLRDLFFFSGITTFTSRVDKKHGKSIYHEKELNALLYEKRMSELFDPDDLLLFKFVLVEKAGYNLRHKIAHSLMLNVEYQINYIHLLLLLLLKIGSYNLRVTKKADVKESA